MQLSSCLNSSIYGVCYLSLRALVSTQVAARNFTLPSEVVQLLSIAFAGVYEYESLSLQGESARQGRRGESGLQENTESITNLPHPAATASDLPARPAGW